MVIIRRKKIQWIVKMVFVNLSFFITSYNLYGQPYKIAGQVKDVYGDALPGVVILSESLTYGAITDIDGKFEIDLSSKSEVLKFSYKKFKSVRKQIDIQDGQSYFLEVELVPDNRQYKYGESTCTIVIKESGDSPDKNTKQEPTFVAEKEEPTKDNNLSSIREPSPITTQVQIVTKTTEKEEPNELTTQKTNAESVEINIDKEQSRNWEESASLVMELMSGDGGTMFFNEMKIDNPENIFWTYDTEKQIVHLYFETFEIAIPKAEKGEYEMFNMHENNTAYVRFSPSGYDYLITPEKSYNKVKIEVIEGEWLWCKSNSIHLYYGGDKQKEHYYIKNINVVAKKK